ncbi:MAG: isoleucine--tRNA ligase [Firmicutes bacterium]|jgi:isoleucyl-tRNA synthetase|nr:isoleucine--tRNA ligase [Bacillota bacterium]
MDYRKTVLVGKTDFPMRANLAQREPKRLAQWQASGMYEKLQKERREAGLPRFVLHDGPPYANGHIHLGTALNKVLKDMIIRSRSMDGHWAPYVPGWDCHGLPVELQAMKDIGLNLDSLSPVEFRQRCRDYALKYIDIQREEFRRLGVWGDWDNPYLTMHPEYEATQIEIFGQMALKGFIYKGRKPVYWCTDCQTALAEAEIEYHDHVSWSIYVRFLVTDDKQMLKAADCKTYVLIWTTTPWTLPANLAIAVNPHLSYVLVRVAGERYVIAEELLSQVAEELQWSEYSIEDRFVGSDLEGIVTRHPFVDRPSPLILGEHVTLDAGTGCVHTAPGHGLEDYEVGLRYGLDVFAPVDNKGRFTEEAGAYAHMSLSEANPVIVEDMRRNGSLMKADKLEHQYPHCWRCKKPVIFRATEQWFASVDGFREEALAAIQQVQWIPHWGIDRITGMIKDRHDWCISRQRLWGVPIPVFYCQSCDAYLVTEESIAAVAELFRKHGADAWWTHEAEEILPEGTTCKECGGRSFRKETDIMDVWFDSGSSHAAVCAKHPNLHWPADMYLEGSDQHRGWFQSSLLTSVAAYGKPPFRSVLTHGFIVDAEGHKMSKSVGNVIAPEEIINKYGADILRLWVASADYRGDISISEGILEQTAEVYRRIRNTARFMLANIGDFHPEHRIPYDELPELDKWALMRTERLYQRVVQAYRDCEFHILHQAIHNFCAVDMGGFYLDVLKDILYCDDADSFRRRSAQSVLCDILITLVQLIAPVLPFTAEEVWEYLPAEAKDKESVHLTIWRPMRTELLDAELERRWEHFFDVRKTVARALEQARNSKPIGSSNEATIHIYAEPTVRQLLESFSDLPLLLMVSEVHLHDVTEHPVSGLSQQEDGILVVLQEAEGAKCERCWRHSREVGTHNDHPSLCTRCFDVVTSL